MDYRRCEVFNTGGRRGWTLTQSVNTLFKYEVGGIESFPFRNIIAFAVSDIEVDKCAIRNTCERRNEADIQNVKV